MRARACTLDGKGCGAHVRTRVSHTRVHACEDAHVCVSVCVRLWEYVCACGCERARARV